MARKIRTIADGSVRNFGTSDCSCSTHLLQFRDDPLNTPAFLDILQHFRIDRLEGLL